MKVRSNDVGKIFFVIFLLFSSLIIPAFTVLSEGNFIIKNSNVEYQETEYWALLVAVGVYADDTQQNRPLMLQEVDDLYDLLLESSVWSEDHIKVLKGKDATALNIISGLQWLDKMEDENDISLFYITTHGNHLGIDIPPKDEEDLSDEVLATYWTFAYDFIFLYDDQLNYRLNKLESKGVCFIVDSCYAGGFNDPPTRNLLFKNHFSKLKKQNSMSAQKWNEEFGAELSGQNRVILMASGEDEVSFSGGFAPYLIDGLRGFADINSDNIVTAEEAFYYTEPRTSRQHPTMYDGYPGELPIMFLSDTVQNSLKNNPDVITESNIYLENSKVKGYVKANDTGIPIENAPVSIWGREDNWNYFENETLTDSNGFYSFNVPESRCRVSAFADGYCGSQVGPLEINENETVWANLSMHTRPTETSFINGYITDEESGQPVKNANIELYWRGDFDQFYLNDTISDDTGYYKMNVAPGEIDIEVRDDEHFPEYTDDIVVSEYEEIQLDFELYTRPTENAVICGYVTDKETVDPIDNVRVTMLWVDQDLDHEYENMTFTDSSGFFKIDIATGEIYNDIRKQGYEYYNPYRIDAKENKDLWMNISLDHSDIIVDIVKPLKAFYINNNRVFPYTKARIIGNIDIEALVYSNYYGHGGDAEKVEFYIDNQLKSTVYQEPFIWNWSEKTFGKHTIKVIAYDDGNSVSEEIEVYKFL